MGFADTERNRAAVHEAGHALVAASRGLGVAVIELHGSDGSGGTRLRDAPSELDRVWILYGGPFAEKVVFGRWTPAPIPPECDELLLAHTICRQMGINNTIGIMDRVQAYLREQQDRLEIVSARLLEADTVQGAELDELLREDVLSYVGRATCQSFSEDLGQSCRFERGGDGALGQQAIGVGKPKAASDSLRQWHTHLRFQLGEMMTHRWLGVVQRLRRRGDRT